MGVLSYCGRHLEHPGEVKQGEEKEGKGEREREMEECKVENFSYLIL